MADIFESGYSSTLERTDAYLQPSTGTYKAALGNSIENEFAVQSFSSGSMISVLNAGKDLFTSTTAGYRMGIDEATDTYKWIIGDSSNSVDWNVTTANTLTIKGAITGSTITGGTLQTAASGQRIRLISATGATPTQAANSFALIDSNNNILCSIGSETSRIVDINVYTNIDGLRVTIPTSSYWDTHAYDQSLVKIVFDPVQALATGNALYVSNLGRGHAIQILNGGSDSASAAALYIANSYSAHPAVEIYNDSNSTGHTIYVESGATGGYPIYVSNINSTSTYSVLALQQTKVYSTYFRKIIDYQGIVLWYTSGTTPNGNLTGTRADVCFSSGGGGNPVGIYVNTDAASGTTWTLLS